MTPLEISAGIFQSCLKIFATFLGFVIAITYVSDRADQDKVVNGLLRCIAVWAPWVLVDSPSMEFLGSLGLLCSQTIGCYHWRLVAMWNPGRGAVGSSVMSAPVGGLFFRYSSCAGGGIARCRAYVDM